MKGQGPETRYHTMLFASLCGDTEAKASVQSILKNVPLGDEATVLVPIAC